MLATRAGSEEAKAVCREVYEAVRYSDPVSDAALSETEGRIAAQLDALKAAVHACDEDKIKAAAGEMLSLIKERNAKCRALK